MGFRWICGKSLSFHDLHFSRIFDRVHLVASVTLVGHLHSVDKIFFSLEIQKLSNMRMAIDWYVDIRIQYVDIGHLNIYIQIVFIEISHISAIDCILLTSQSESPWRIDLRNTRKKRVTDLFAKNCSCSFGLILLVFHSMPLHGRLLYRIKAIWWQKVEKEYT